MSPPADRVQTVQARGRLARPPRAPTSRARALRLTGCGPRPAPGRSAANKGSPVVGLPRLAGHCSLRGGLGRVLFLAAAALAAQRRIAPRPLKARPPARPAAHGGCYAAPRARPSRCTRR